MTKNASNQGQNVSLDPDRLDRVQTALRANERRYRWLTPADRDGIVQEALATLIEADREGRLTPDDDGLVRYALTIYRNLAALRLRKLYMARRASERAPRRKQSAEPAPYESLSTEERQGVIARALASLSDEDREIVLLRQRGQTFDQIAGVLGKESTNIRQRYVRALQHVRDACFREERGSEG